MAVGESDSALTILLNRMSKTPTNAEFLVTLAKNMES
jgi:hypothetical protein